MTLQMTRETNLSNIGLSLLVIYRTTTRKSTAQVWHMAPPGDTAGQLTEVLYVEQNNYATKITEKKQRNDT